MHALALQFAASLAHEAFQITHGPAEGVLRAARRTGPSIKPSAITVGDVLPPFSFRLQGPPGRCVERLRHGRQNYFSHSA
jgi:hypothetical protein